MSQLIQGTTGSQINAIDAVDKLTKYAEILSGSSIIPAHYRGQKSDVFVAVQTAYRMNLDPLMVMQGTYIVKGKLGMVTSFAISLANSSGKLKGGISYDVVGEGAALRVTAKAVVKSSGEEISYTIGMKEAMAEGWTSNPKYKSLPELMLRYRAATLLIRTHIPEVLNGMHTVEELSDVEAANSAKNGANSTMKDVSTKDKAVNTLDQYLDEDESEAIEVLTENMSKAVELEKLIELNQVPQETVAMWLEKAQVEKISELSEEKVKACIEFVREKTQSTYVNN